MLRIRFIVVLIVLMTVTLFGHLPGSGQTPPANASQPAGAAGKAPTTETKIKRWFEFEQLSTGARYNFAENASKIKTSNSLQYQFVARFRVKFDKKAKYSLVTNVATGTSFVSYWDNTGIGIGSPRNDIAVRQLYFDAKPHRSVQVQVGGLFVNYGETSEVISYDNENYILGERVQIRAPKKLYFDEISITSASLSDTAIPNVFRRLKHFDNQNYRQFLVRKQVHKNIGFSAEYTFQSGMDILRQAVRFKIPPKNVVDTVLFEQYQRLDPDKDYGFNLFADRKLNNMFTVAGGFARTNIRPSLNSDRFPPGKRIYFVGQMKLSPEFGLSLQATRGVGFIQPNLTRNRVSLVFTYNILETLKRTRFF